MLNNDYSKLDHGLTATDLNPKDRQNYGSCARIASDDVLNLLVDGDDTYRTYVYLLMLKMVIETYVDKAAEISERMYAPFFSKHGQLFHDVLYLLSVFCRFGVLVVPCFHLSPVVDMDSKQGFLIYKSNNNAEKV